MSLPGPIPGGNSGTGHEFRKGGEIRAGPRIARIWYDCDNMADRPTVSTTVGDGGRIVIPASYRKVLGLRKGSQVLLSLRDSEIRLLSVEAARKRARDFVRSLVPPGVSLADELIRERREEAKRE